MFRVTSIRDRDTVQQLMHIDEADPLRRGRPGQSTTPVLPELRGGFAADQVVTRDAIEKKRRQERMWRSVKNKIKASAYVARMCLGGGIYCRRALFSRLTLVMDVWL